MREFRLPLREARDSMDLDVLKSTLDQYERWYFMNEEGMSMGQARGYWARRTELADYINRRERSHVDTEKDQARR